MVSHHWTLGANGLRRYRLGPMPASVVGGGVRVLPSWSSFRVHRFRHEGAPLHRDAAPSWAIGGQQERLLQTTEVLPSVWGQFVDDPQAFDACTMSEATEAGCDT